MSEPKTVTIVLADELNLVREGLASLCEVHPMFRVVGQCAEGVVAIRLIESLKPDVAILDLSLPDLFTLEIVRRIRESNLPTRVVVLSTRRDRKTVVEALRCGASAFLLKSGSASQLREAIEQIMEGGVYVSPMLELNELFSANHQRKTADDPLDTLSAREYQVFSLLVDGVRAKEIAARLELSPKTVDTYRASLMRKLDIHDVAGLVKFAIQRDLTSTR